ncbi:MAG: inositol monophosphatase family protein [Parvularculaceae bacterium]|nr:inositol monophosphatase family protein [Parvularculaceae bacterium]
MTIEPLDDYAAFAGRLADAARAETLPRFRAKTEIHNKVGVSFDPVTDADREAERAQRRMIAAVYPHHGVIGEEFGKERPDAEWRWVLDPVDGTRAFICGATTWATLIALEKSKTPVLGLIDQPFTDERWIGRAGARTVYTRGGAVIECAVSGVNALSHARVSTTDPRRDGYMTGDEVEAFSAVAAKARVARFSLDAYAYGLLALGEVDLVIESSLNHHDYAALIPVVEGAGGVVTGWKGESVHESERGRVIASAGPALHEAALKILQAAMPR